MRLGGVVARIATATRHTFICASPKDGTQLAVHLSLRRQAEGSRTRQGWQGRRAAGHRAPDGRSAWQGDARPADRLDRLERMEARSQERTRSTFAQGGATERISTLHTSRPGSRTPSTTARWATTMQRLLQAASRSARRRDYRHGRASLSVPAPIWCATPPRPLLVCAEGLKRSSTSHAQTTTTANRIRRAGGAIWPTGCPTRT